MKLVRWTDRAGFRRAALLREGDSESMAERGVPLSPPDLNGVEWEEVKRDLHNALVDQGLFTWQDVQREQRAVQAAVTACLHRRVIQLYRAKDTADKTAKETMQ